MPKSKKVTIVGADRVRSWARENMDTVSALTVTKTRWSEPGENGKRTRETYEVPADLSSLTGGPQGTGRGRLAANGPIVAAFHKANPTEQFGEKVPTPEATVEVKVTKTDSKGRKRTSTRKVTVSEVRALSGQKAGRLSAASIKAAGDALAQA